MSTCDSPELIRRWLDGELPDEQATIVGSHVVECSRCQAALDEETGRAELRRWLPSGSFGRVADDDAIVDGLLAHIRATPPIHQGERTVIELEVNSSSGPTPRPGVAERSLGTFHLLDELGRGGMGIVHRAWDTALHREVAIKILRPEMAEPAYRLRLVREAQFAAQFRHDHAVLVFSVVDPPDGLPYLVMEYVAGRSLAELLAQSSRPGVREVATWIAQVAGALEAAHASGLIHRDVKPGNILIDQASGRAKIADFGLARTAGLEASVTHFGWAAGTPTYMSPEQAAGVTRLDPRTDVYSLGATLYESLTGVAPFQGEPHLVLRQIIEENPRPLRQLNDRVARDLETICLKAMEREPSRRYPTAAAMADDLHRWLRGESIRARPVGRPEQFYRWCRRNPRVAGLSAALVVVFAAGFAAVTWQWRRAEHNALRAGILRRQAESNLEDSRASLQQARHAVDQFYARFYEQGVINVPGLEKVRHEVLGELIEFYKSFIARHGDDPSLRRDVAEACSRLGRLTFDHGNKADALDLLRHALQQFDRLSGESPSDPEDLRKIGKCLNSIGQLEYALGQNDSARRTYERGIIRMEALVRDHPADPLHPRILAALHGNLAVLLTRQGQREHARREYRAAQQLQQELVERVPDSLESLNDLGMTYNNLAFVTDDKEESISLLRKGLDVRQQVAQRSPTSPYFLRNVARSHQNLGSSLSTLARHDQALVHLEESRRLMEQVVGEQPAVLDYQSDLAQALVELGDVLARLGRRDAARSAWERARSIFRKLLHDNPEDFPTKEGLATVEAYLARPEGASRSAHPGIVGEVPPANPPGAEPRPR